MNPDSLDELLGIDRTDPMQRLACQLVEADHALIDALVQARKKAGLSQAEVAERMGTTARHVAALELIDADPGLSTLRRYAMAVGARVTHTVSFGRTEGDKA